MRSAVLALSVSMSIFTVVFKTVFSSVSGLTAGRLHPEFADVHWNPFFPLSKCPVIEGTEKSRIFQSHAKHLMTLHNIKH